MVLTAVLFGKTPACQTNLRHDWGSGRTRASVRRGEKRPVSAQGRHLTYNSAAVGYFCPALSCQQIDEEAVAPGCQFSDAAPGRFGGGNTRGQTLFRL
jgi:hypothetical protein